MSDCPKTVIATAGAFHFFNMAKQLDKHGGLEAILTGYPNFKIRRSNMPKGKVHSHHYWNTPYIIQDIIGQPSRKLKASLEYLSFSRFDQWASQKLPDAEVFIGMSASSLLTHRAAKARGMKTVCDRGCSHIQFQSDILQEEFKEWNLGHFEVNPKIIERETKEYEEADLVFVPSTFSYDSFVKLGVPKEKLRIIPYGVDVGKFYQDGEPDPEAFTVLFVGLISLRKGIPYLFEAFKKLDHPKKRLILAGTVRREVREMLEAMGQRRDVEILGPVNQPRLRRVMSESNVLVLPSVEDGFGLVMAEAMACGTPVISTDNTGGADLYEDGKEGFIVPIRNSEAIRSRLQQLSEDHKLRARMVQAGLERVKAMAGWDQYGDRVCCEISSLVGRGKFTEGTN